MKIENEFYIVEVDAGTGALTGVLDRAAKRQLISEPRLAESFRLLVPLPQLESNYILGIDQAAPEIENVGHRLTMRWDDPLQNAQGTFDIAVSVVIELVDDTVRFRLNAANHSAHELAEVWHAGLGGITGLGPRPDTKILLPRFGTAAPEDLFQNFPESMGIGGGGGMRFPEFYTEYPKNLSMPWTDIYNPALGRGMYYGCHDEVARTSVLRFEMHPGLARNRLGGNWPSEAETAVMAETFPVGVIIHWVNMPYTPPGGEFTGPTVTLRCHDGDWHTGAKTYRTWFLSRFPIRRAEESWLRRQQAVQDAMFLLPEGDVKLTFKDIPRWARDAADHGVTAVMISGWNVGGHDNQYPNYTPDPRLGTWEELAEGVAACHEIGVKVLFFSNIQFVDTSTEWYRRELGAYAVTTKRGARTTAGWGMGTLGARMGYTCPPCGVCDPAFPEYRRIIVDQMRKLAEIGADGIHYDKVGGGCMDFNPDLPARPDEAHPQGIIACMEETLAACRPIRPDFCLGVESQWDRLLSYCDAWWLWFDDEHVPVMKYTFPELLPTFAVAQPWDYVNVNRAVQYGYQILVGPVRYSASMADKQSQPISRYIREIIRIREELKDTIFFGDFLDEEDVDVDSTDHLTYKTHRHATTGKRACVLANLGAGPVRARVRFKGRAAEVLRLYRPFEEAATQDAPAEVSVPGERLVIVVEL